jgi:hypothetical protein
MVSRPPSEARTLGACLNDAGSAARSLLARADRLLQIESALREWAEDARLARSLRIANERGGRLLVYADSAAAATTLRYRRQELIQFLRQKLGLNATAIDVKIRPPAPGGVSRI